MLANDLMLDAFARNAELVPAVLEGLTPEDILWRPDSGSNSIGWLLWHLSRVEDDHLAGIAGRSQVWERWRDRFNLPYGDAVGFGQSAADVEKFNVGDAGLLTGYYADVHAQTVEILSSLSEDDYARVVDENWTPPVTLGVRVISVVNDTFEHLGQCSYLRGLRERSVGKDSGWAGIPGYSTTSQN